MISRVIAASAALAFPVAAMAAKPSPRLPTGKWVVKFADAQCVAQRNYGTDDRPLYLVLKQPPLGNVMQVAVVQKRSAGAPVQFDGSLAFDGAQPSTVSVLEYQPQGTKMRTYLVNLPLESFAPATRARSVRIKTEGLDANLALSGVQPLLKVMDECVADLRKVWNISDPQTERSAVQQGARGNLQTLFSPADYPREALGSGKGGTVRVALLVNENGKVADCSIIQTSGIAVLDAQTCAVLKDRARFTPRIGRDGNPAKEGYIQAIAWSAE